MTAIPQTEKGHIKIATGGPDNDILSALVRASLHGAEYQVVLFVIRKTWGFNKKEDAISLTQFEKETGLARSTVCRVIKRLVARRILVSRKTLPITTYGFNKLFSQWVVAPTPLVAQMNRGSSVDETGVVAPVGHTKATTTKAILQKQEPEKKTEGIERTFKRLAVEHAWCDDHYASKTWMQGISLPAANRTEFLRKVNIVVNSARHDRTRGLAKKVFHEVAGYVNDFGDMARCHVPPLADE